jgi:hypothetical protein
MQPEGVARLLAPGTVVDVPGGELELLARRLVSEGLARGNERGFVLCACPADADFAFTTDRTCPGRIYLSDDDNLQWCPRCERRVTAGGKQEFRRLALDPGLPAIQDRLVAMLQRLHTAVREQPRGVLRVESPSGEAAVVLLDVCEPRARSMVDQGAIAVAADVGRWSYGLAREHAPLSVAELLLTSPEPLLTKVRAALAGQCPVLFPQPEQAVTPPRSAARFHVPPSANWSDVTIYCVDGATVGVCVPGERPVHVSAVELGMAKDKARTPAKRFALLVHLCMHRGRTDWRHARTADDHPVVFDNFAAFKMQATALRRDLQRLFGRVDDPFANFGERKPLVAAFRALAEAPGRVEFERRVG